MLENEREMILRWKKGDKKAYEALVRHYMSDAYLIAYGYVGNYDDARDMSQDAFIKVYQARESFDADRPFYPWLYRVLKNHCLNFLKKRSRGGLSLYYQDSPDRERFASPSPTPLEELEKDERKRLLRGAITLLSDDHREIIVLKNYKGYSYTEISETLEIPIGTVMSRLYYARRALKDLLHKLETEGLPDVDAEGFVGEGSPAPGEVI